MICKLCEKALAQSMQVLIYTQTSKQAVQLDELLWSYKADSFIAHHYVQTDNETCTSEFDYPVTICAYDDEHDNFDFHAQLLINLAENPVTFFEKFERIAEMVDKDSLNKEAGRYRYRFYQEKGYTPNKYDL